MKVWMVGCCAALLLSLPTSRLSADEQPGLAQVFDFRSYELHRSETRAGLEDAQRRCRELRVQLAALGTSDTALTHSYLQSAADVLHAALSYHYAASQQFPLLLTHGALQGAVTDWPGNPYEDWLPMPVLPTRAAFRSGALVLQLPPAEYYSYDFGRLQPLSYQVYAYGANVDEQLPTGLAVLMENTAWAVPPPGAVAVCGQARPPFSVKAPAEPGLAALLSQAEDEAWQRELALGWTATQLNVDDAQTLGWLARSLESQLRAARRVELLAQGLKAQPREDWTAEVVETYQREALWLIFQGFNNATWAGGGGAMPDWAEFESRGLLPYWPGNPHKGWQPIRLLDSAAGFSAGDIQLQQAPAYFAQLGAKYQLSGSFEMFAFGASALSSSVQPVVPSPMNPWASRPPGTVVSLGSFAAPQAAAEFNRAVCHS